MHIVLQQCTRNVFVDVPMCADIVKIGDKRPYYQLEMVHKEHLIVAVAGDCL